MPAIAGIGGYTQDAPQGPLALASPWSLTPGATLLRGGSLVDPILSLWDGVDSVALYEHCKPIDVRRWGSWTKKQRDRGVGYKWMPNNYATSSSP